MSTNVQNVNFSSEIAVSMEGSDLETALMLVQHARVKLLDEQLATQMNEVDARNKKVAQLNDVLTGLNQIAAQFPSDAKPESTLKEKANWTQDKKESIQDPLNDAIAAAGITDLGFTSGNGSSMVTSSATKADVDAAITKVKGMIDGLSNTQQLDMLRLQSLVGKRNEAFDVMTNITKKLSDQRSSIVSNLR